MEYHHPKRTDFSESLFGSIVTDPYRYMEDPLDKDAITFVEANNALLETYLDDKIKTYFTSRLTQIVDFDRYTSPVQKGNRYFFQKHKGMETQPALYYQEGINGESKLVVHFADLSEDGTLAPTAITYSDDGYYTAVSLSQSGSDWHDLVILVTDTSEEIDRLSRVRFAVPQWSSDGKSFYYTKFPDSDDIYGGTSQDGRIFLHQVGSSQNTDVEIFKPDDIKESPGITISKDHQYGFISTGYSSGMGNKLYIINLESLNLNVVNPSFEGINYGVIGDVDGHLYIQTNLNAPLQQIIRVPINDPDLVKAESIIPESENLIKSVKMAGKFLFVQYLIKAISVVKQYDLDGKCVGDIKLPSMGTVMSMSGKIGSDNFFYQFTSYPYLPTIFHLDIQTGQISQYFDNRSSFDQDKFILKQVEYPSKDGTTISMFIIHRKDLELDNKNPCLLWSYGGFNISLTPGASLRERYKVRLMIEEGGVYACPNIRGGGEYGREWHQAGTKDRKQNVFDDYIAAAEYLIAEGYTSNKLICSHGGSNGGLLVGATLLQRPDLFGAAIGEAGVMDMLRYHKFTFGRYWIGDYGDPEKEEDFKYLVKYSPVHNVKPMDYPPSLFYCADTDTRVVPMHTKKFVAELQYAQQGDAPILMRTETKAGHNFGKPMTKVIDETAIMFCFLWQVLGLEIPSN